MKFWRPLKVVCNILRQLFKKRIPKKKKKLKIKIVPLQESIPLPFGH